jgi:hypothetical protein
MGLNNVMGEGLNMTYECTYITTMAKFKILSPRFSWPIGDFSVIIT